MEQATSPVITKYPVPYITAVLLVVIAISIFITIESGSQISDVQTNWSEYRCQPHMMPFAGLFGYDMNENFQFCIQQIIKEQTKGVTGPFAQGMSGFTSVLMNLMDSANSFRTMLATLVGGIIKIISEFKSRMTALMGRIKLTASRMRAMMYRIYGTMFAVIYMGMSAQTGIANFGDTFIFRFIDTFCFPPEQELVLEDGTKTHISDILIGDVLEGGHIVESTYKFIADGQEMVDIQGIQVSSNHFIEYNNSWIMAIDHPHAIRIGPWRGSISRPLFCLSTHNHRIKINGYTFADYDETEEANAITQKWVSESLNGRRKDTPHPECSYEIGLTHDTKIKTLEGYKKISDIQLGTKISETSTVVGIQESVIDSTCSLASGIKIGKGTLIWNKEKEEWMRAYSMCSIDTSTQSVPVIALFVNPGAYYELEDGTIIRDAMEIYSPDTKKPYADILLSTKVQ